jgi:sigma-54 dependent transcriptional regulator, acetoin dehydrogenase operon transcriptional activator AcoR
MAAKQAASGFPYPLQESEVMEAWERLVCGVGLPADAVRTVIERSWVRCHSAGVDPATTRAPSPTSDEGFGRLLHRFRDVIDVGVSVMAQVRESLSESGTVMILTDPSGVILKTEGDPATLEAAQDVRLVNGANWDELVCGTNAIGTALSLKEPVQVHATEHFCAGIKPWSCSAVVLRDPAYGEILGVVDVSGLSSRFHRNWLALATMTAGRIEAELAVRQMESRWRLAEAGLQSLSMAASSAVMLFDRQGRLVKAEGVAGHSRASLGGCGDWNAGRRIEAFDTDSGHGDAALPDWLRPEWVQPVMRGGQRLGTVLVLPDSLQREPARRIVNTRAPTFTVGQTSTTLGPIIGRSATLRQALEKAKHLADLDVPVLLQGETGVGKEMFARAIHEGRQRTTGPFVALNCGGLPRDTLASELFGYVDGAFTGAKRSGMIGKIEAARGGTLFLDEIGEMPLDLQPYLLRVLEGGELYPLGASQPRTVQFKLIAATNRDLRAEVVGGRFRQDLFYRVSVTTLRIPALRERKEDIAELVEHFNREVSRRHGVPVKRFEAEVIDAFERYAWPGNVREMRHVVEGLVMLTNDDTVTAAALPEEIALAVAAPGREPGVSAESAAVRDLDAVERDAISTAIARRQGNLTMVAKDLRISKSTLYLKIDKYGLNPTLRQARQHDR